MQKSQIRSDNEYCDITFTQKIIIHFFTCVKMQILLNYIFKIHTFTQQFCLNKFSNIVTSFSPIYILNRCWQKQTLETTKPFSILWWSIRVVGRGVTWRFHKNNDIRSMIRVCVCSRVPIRFVRISLVSIALLIAAKNAQITGPRDQLR